MPAKRAGFASLYPSLYQSFYLLGLSQGLRGEYAPALASAETAHSLAPWNTNSAGLLARALARAGHRERAEELLRELSAGQPYGVAIAWMLYY